MSNAASEIKINVIVWWQVTTGVFSLAKCHCNEPQKWTWTYSCLQINKHDSLLEIENLTKKIVVKIKFNEKTNGAWRCDSEDDDYEVEEEEWALPKIPLPVRPFLIRYIAQDRGPELENGPGFILQSWVQKQQELGPNFQHPEKEKKKKVSREKKN